MINSAGQTERRLEEATDETTIEAEAAGTEQETIPQATYDSLAFLAVSSDTNAYIIVEREKSLIVINVRSDISDIIDVNDEKLKLPADAFDFSAIP